jgi:lysophospholipase L1-like esterase
VRIHAELPEARIYVLSVKPSIAREATWPAALEVNERYQELAAADPLLHYIDVATPFMNADGTVMTDIFRADDLHLNDKGYDIWAAAIKEVLMKHEAQYEHGTH